MTQPLVLVTNDDGADAPGIAALTAALSRAGAQVAVVAPETNHTAGSRRITFERRLIARRTGPLSFTCSGTPADCVRVGILSGLLPRPHLVVTGINHGANAGEDVYYSGTVAAAAEAALLGVPAVAVSKDGDGGTIPFLSAVPDDFEGADLAAEFSLGMLDKGWDLDVVLNVNIPATFQGEPEVVWCTVGQREWSIAGMGALHETEAEVVLDPWAEPPAAVLGAGTDFLALSAGRATVTAIKGRRALGMDLAPAAPGLRSASQVPGSDNTSARAGQS